MKRPDLSFHREMLEYDMQEISEKHKKKRFDNLLNLVSFGFKFRTSKKLISQAKMHVDIDHGVAGKITISLYNMKGDKVSFESSIDKMG